MHTDIVNIIFGMKIREARKESNLKLKDFAQQCDLSPSYITEIEKGRKYPKTDKIMKMAEVLGKDYDSLVSIKLDASLKSLETLLKSPLLKHFPFEEFGLEASSLVNIITKIPERASALAQALIAIGRQYDLQGEHFLRAALRSYQEMNENYFQSIEDAAVKFNKRYKMTRKIPLSLSRLEELVQTEFGYTIDKQHLATSEILSSYRSVYVAGPNPKLLLNSALQDSQLKFLIAREFGYKILGLKQRANTSAPDKVVSYDQVLNDFRASYFAGALLMPRQAILEDIQTFFDHELWQPDYLSNLLLKYDVTQEMLLYRLSELIPQFFGIKCHFVRFNSVNGNYRLVKQLNLGRLLMPSGVALDEHLCRRWLAVRLLKKLQQKQESQPIVGCQISEFLDSRRRVLSFGIARSLALSPEIGSSVTLGILLTPTAKKIIRFSDDLDIPFAIINETCERCSLTTEQCAVRGAAPTIYQAEQKQEEREKTLKQLMAQLRG